MSDASARPVIFISYSHKDEPDPLLQPGAFQWLSYVKSFLEPAAAQGIVELWDDRRIDGGGDWRADINEALERCAVCVFLVSRHSLSSRFILHIEMKRILERHHARGAHLYPIVITSVDLGVAPWLLKLNLKPPNGTALELYGEGPRNKVMADLAAQIRAIVERAAANSASGNSTGDRAPRISDMAAGRAPTAATPAIHITGRPETANERLVGRGAELKRLDEPWTDDNTTILSLVGDVSLRELAHEFPEAVARLFREIADRLEHRPEEGHRRHEGASAATLGADVDDATDPAHAWREVRQRSRSVLLATFVVGVVLVCSSAFWLINSNRTPVSSDAPAPPPGVKTAATPDALPRPPKKSPPYRPPFR